MHKSHRSRSRTRANNCSRMLRRAFGVAWFNATIKRPINSRLFIPHPRFVCAETIDGQPAPRMAGNLDCLQVRFGLDNFFLNCAGHKAFDHKVKKPDNLTRSSGFNFVCIPRLQLLPPISSTSFSAFIICAVAHNELSLPLIIPISVFTVSATGG